MIGRAEGSRAGGGARAGFEEGLYITLIMFTFATAFLAKYNWYSETREPGTTSVVLD